MTFRTKIASMFLGIFVLSTPFTAGAVGLNFGGKILSSNTRVCYFQAGVVSIPVPLQVIRIRNSSGTGTTTLSYIYYQFILQIFGVTTSLYQNFQFYRSGPSVIGQYVPAPIPWSNCPDLIPTKVIIKIGTSLF